jgi:hypothetical protein
VKEIYNETTEDYIARREAQEDIKELFRTSTQAIESISNISSKEITKTRIIYKTLDGQFVGLELRKNQIKFHLYFKRNSIDHNHKMIRNQSEAESVIDLCKKQYS